MNQKNFSADLRSAYFFDKPRKTCIDPRIYLSRLESSNKEDVIGHPLTTVAAIDDQSARLFAELRGLGFDKCVYVVEALGGAAIVPLAAYGTGLTEAHANEFIGRASQDPLRRMLSRGEIPIGSAPITYENSGRALSIAPGRKLSVADASLLRWCLAQGVRTGITFRILMTKGRYASVNYYSAQHLTEAELDTAVQALFLFGHRFHERVEPTLPSGPGHLLSAREIDCIEQMALGLGNREIAETLGIAVDTVKDHIQSIFHKLDVANRAQAVSRAHTLAYLA